jgi:hypothetical protein
VGYEDEEMLEEIEIVGGYLYEPHSASNSYEISKPRGKKY